MEGFYFSDKHYSHHLCITLYYQSTLHYHNIIQFNVLVTLYQGP